MITDEQRKNLLKCLSSKITFLPKYDLTHHKVTFPNLIGECVFDELENMRAYAYYEISKIEFIHGWGQPYLVVFDKFNEMFSVIQGMNQEGLSFLEMYSEEVLDSFPRFTSDLFNLSLEFSLGEAEYKESEYFISPARCEDYELIHENDPPGSESNPVYDDEDNDENDEDDVEFIDIYHME